ncbi:hypothetical protein Q3G72_021629 [Acer saccharum]|nr:hypothetical protein Q3G72_021629 [Acer saccharum]
MERVLGSSPGFSQARQEQLNMNSEPVVNVGRSSSFIGGWKATKGKLNQHQVASFLKQDQLSLSLVESRESSHFNPIASHKNKMSILYALWEAFQPNKSFKSTCPPPLMSSNPSGSEQKRKDIHDVRFHSVPSGPSSIPQLITLDGRLRICIARNLPSCVPSTNMGKPAPSSSPNQGIMQGAFHASTIEYETYSPDRVSNYALQGTHHSSSTAIFTCFGNSSIGLRILLFLSRTNLRKENKIPSSASSVSASKDSISSA